MGLFSFLRRNSMERPGYELYGAAVVAARDPFFYNVIGVPDTLDGRFDLVGLHAFLMIRRVRLLPPPGPALAQAIFDAMFSDMDVNLREMGVGDLSVGKRVKEMWEAFHGRAATYEEAMSSGAPDLMAEALERNVWRGEEAGEGPVRLAKIAYARDAELGRRDIEAFKSGKVAFGPVAELLS